MLSIGEFSKISNVTTKTLRYYDEIGLIKPIHVNSANGYRYYGVEQLKSLLLINKLKLYCFTLDEIAEALRHPEDQQRLLARIREKQRGMQAKMDAFAQVLRLSHQDAAKLERGIDIMAYMEEIPVKLAEKEPMNILFSRQRMNVHEYGNYIGKLFETIAREKLTPTGPPMTIFHAEEYDPEDYDMEIAIPVRETVNGTREFKSGLCAMAILKGSYSGLPAIYAKLKEYVEAEGLEPAGAPFELYLTNPGDTPADENITEVYLPVKK